MGGRTGLLRFAGNAEGNAPQHARFGGPESQLDLERSRLMGDQLQAHDRLGVREHLDGPLLLRTGAAQGGSAEFAVDTGQAEGMGAGVLDRDFDDARFFRGDGAHVDRRVIDDQERDVALAVPQPAAGREAGEAHEEAEPEEIAVDLHLELSIPEGDGAGEAGFRR
jgi:hypothetical protein